MNVWRTPLARRVIQIPELQFFLHTGITNDPQGGRGTEDEGCRRCTPVSWLLGDETR